jgi:hypothetical protein
MSQKKKNNIIPNTLRMGKAIFEESFDKGNMLLEDFDTITKKYGISIKRDILEQQLLTNYLLDKLIKLIAKNEK